MYNVHLSWLPSGIKLTITRGALRKKKKEKMKLINKKRERREWIGVAEEKGGGDGWMDLCFHQIQCR